MMFNPKNIFHIQLKDLNRSIDISDIFEQYRTKHTAYTIACKLGVIKHGIGADNEWKRGIWGNRVYKQCLGIPGWHGRNDPTHWDSSAKEMHGIITKYFPYITKDDIMITVYDFTSTKTETDDFHRQSILSNAEKFLVDMHETAHGAMPLGNKEAIRSRPHYHAYNKLFIDNGDDLTQ